MFLAEHLMYHILQLLLNYRSINNLTLTDDYLQWPAVFFLEEIFLKTYLNNKAPSNQSQKPKPLSSNQSEKANLRGGSSQLSINTWAVLYFIFCDCLCLCSFSHMNNNQTLINKVNDTGNVVQVWSCLAPRLLTSLILKRSSWSSSSWDGDTKER